jgi:hypothetical protein
MTVLTVHGWMTEEEQLFLRRLAFQKDVCEIGSYEGLSTLNLAATARSVTCVDPFDARATFEKPHGTLDAFLENIRNGGVEDKILVRQGLSADVMPTLGRDFDLIFIDGDHSYEAVKLDIQLALPCLREGGLLAFHDYGEENMGVVLAVNEFRDSGAQFRGQAHTLVAFSPVAKESQTKPVVVSLVMPHRNLECNLGAAAGLHFASSTLPQVVTNYGTSVLTQCFNTLLADALNARETDGVTHFAMLHNDVIPCRGWLDILMEEMQANDLDMISAVVPIKNSKGLTSTGMDTPGNPWSVRRLTLSEVYDLPETFTAKDVPYRQDQAQLLLNTGCWLMKLHEPWAEGLHFRQQDRIAWNTTTKKYAAQSISEDWDFSRQLQTRGARIAATRKVPLQHERPEFHNKSVWGDWQTDEAYAEYEQSVKG